MSHSLVPACLPHRNLQDSLMRLYPGCTFTYHTSVRLSVSPPVHSLALQTLANTQQDQGQGHRILVTEDGSAGKWRWQAVVTWACLPHPVPFVPAVPQPEVSCHIHPLKDISVLVLLS